MYRRYASPLSFLDGLIEQGMFTAGLREVSELEGDALLWELYLHKVHDRSYLEFKAGLLPGRGASPRKDMTAPEIAAAVKQADGLLRTFKPKSGG